MARYEPPNLAQPTTTDMTSDLTCIKSRVDSFSQPDTKDLEIRTKSSLVQGLTNKQQSSFDLVSRPKSALDHALPHYPSPSVPPEYQRTGEAAKRVAVRSRQATRSAQFHDSPKVTSKSSRGKPPAIEDETLQPCQILLDNLALDTIRIDRMPTSAWSPIYGSRTHNFSVRIKNNKALFDYFDSTREGPKLPYLDHPLAYGNWLDAICTIKGTKGGFRLYGKVTWGDLIELAYSEHPTRTCFDEDEEDEDDEDAEYTEYWKVEVSLLLGAKVT